MKTESSSSDLFFANNVELLEQQEGGLPVIGSCQVSSILSNLGSTNHEETTTNLDLIILPPSSDQLKLASQNLQNNYVILKDHITTRKDKTKNSLSKKKSKDEDFENMLYFVCNLCPFLCTKDSKITEHIQNAHKNRTVRKLTQLKCPACPNIFYHKLSLRSHLIHDHGVSNSDLNIIIQAVAYYSTQKQKNQKLDTTVMQCKSEINIKNVDKLLTSEKILENEDSDHDFDNDNESSKNSENIEIKSVELPQVDILQNNTEKMFQNLMKQAEDTVSAKLVDQKKSHKCYISMCKVRLQDVAKLKYHVESHISGGFKCLECGEKLGCWKTLTGHLWRSHKIDMELFSCDKCDYKTYSLAKLNNIHKLIHSDVKAFMCETCQKGFKNIKQLRNHKMIHREKSEKSLYSCDDCSKHFSDKRQLKVHLDVVHNKIKPFLCSYCGYKGSCRSSLKMHIRQHTGEKPFSCDSCSYATSDHNSLRRHKLRHSGHKPYKCAYCPYACIQSSTYKVHLKTKHPGMEKNLMFTCHECQFRSVNKDNFTTHMVTVHKLKPPIDDVAQS